MGKIFLFSAAFFQNTLYFGHFWVPNLVETIMITKYHPFRRAIGVILSLFVKNFILFNNYSQLSAFTII